MDMVAKLDRLYPQLLRVNPKCRFCGREAHAIHHIIGRANLLLRYDLNNLIPICDDCHRLVHDKGIEMFIPPLRMYYLNTMKNIQFQDYLLSHNLTREEFFKQKETELKERINGR